MPLRAPYNMLLTPPVLRPLGPERTALLLLDAQHTVCSRERGFGAAAAERGVLREFDEYYAQAEAALANMARLLAACRSRGVRVIHSILAATPDLAQHLREAELPLPDAAALDGEFRPEARPVPGEPVVARGCYSPFLGGALDARLKEGGIERIIIGGMMANIIVALAAREAADRGFSVIVVQDASASETMEWHGLAMQALGGGAIRVQWSFEVLEMLAGTRR